MKTSLKASAFFFLHLLVDRAGWPLLVKLPFIPVFLLAQLNQLNHCHRHRKQVNFSPKSLAMGRLCLSPNYPCCAAENIISGGCAGWATAAGGQRRHPRAGIAWWDLLTSFCKPFRLGLLHHADRAALGSRTISSYTKSPFSSNGLELLCTSVSLAQTTKQVTHQFEKTSSPYLWNQHYF